MRDDVLEQLEEGLSRSLKDRVLILQEQLLLGLAINLINIGAPLTFKLHVRILWFRDQRPAQPVSLLG